MTDTRTSETPENAVAKSPAASVSQPAVRPPKKGTLKLIGEVLNHGGPGMLQFAITNICNADCGFCGFRRSQFDPKLRRSVTLEEAKRVIDIAVKNHMGYLVLFGGEPMVHRDIRAMTRHATERGLRTIITSNGSLFNDENMRGLADDGLSSVVMSVDTHDIAGHEKNRGLPGVCQKLKHANEFFHSVGVQTTASVTLSRLVEDYESLPPFLEMLGFKSCTFSYPMTSLASSYFAYSSSGLVNYPTEELIGLFEKIKVMKERTRFPVANPTESLDEMQRHLRGEKEKFGCLGGHKYFYVDWNLDLWRCHFWDKPMCKVWEWDDSKIIRDNCTRCTIDCYRDASVMHFTAINVSDAWNNLKKGNLAGAAKNIFDSRNLISMKAVWKNREWIRGV